MADYGSELKKLEYQHYASDREYLNFFIDKKALEEVPVKGFQYVFFTAPELGLTRSRFQRAAKADVARLLENTGKELKLPGYSESIYTKEMVSMLAGEAGVFMPIFTNRCRNIPASDEILDTLDYAETWNRYKIPIGTSSKDSKIGGNFELQFRDDDQVTMLKIIKLWKEYIESLFMGRIVSPYATQSSLSDTQTDMIDYMASMYTFSLRPDGKTIQHWSKYTGVFPTKIPYSLFAGNDGEIDIIDSVPVDFQFAYKEDMDIQILRDFNLLGQANNQYLTQPAGSFFDQNSVQLPTIGSYPGIAKVVNRSTGRVWYELHITNPSDIYGVTSNFQVNTP